MECDILDFSEYGNEADRRSDGLLKEALEKWGAITRIIRLTREGVHTALAKRVWLRYDLRTLQDLLFVVETAQALIQSGHLVFPGPTSIRESEDKWASYLILKAAGIPTVETFPMEEIGQCRGPAVVKPRVGWGGMGMRIVSSGAAKKLPLTGAGRNYVWQHFVGHGHTWTALVTGSRNDVLLRKRAKSGDFRTNSGYGEKAELVDDLQGLSDPARKALAVFGLPTGTVDLVDMDGEPVVLDVNSAPCLWYDELLHLDIAGPMARRAMEWLGETSS